MDHLDETMSVLVDAILQPPQCEEGPEQYRRLYGHISACVANEIVRHVLAANAADNAELAWAATLVGRCDEHNGAELKPMFSMGKPGWVLCYPGRWRQGGYREPEEIFLGWPILQEPGDKYEQDILKRLAEGEKILE